MLNKFLLSFGVVYLFASFSIFAQDRLYNTQQYTSEVLSTHPQYLSNKKEIESQYRDYKRFGEEEERRVVVVFHVIGETGLNDGHFIRQIDVLNRDFTNDVNNYGSQPNDPNGDNKRLITDSQIRFCLADTDPRGERTSGILYHKVGRNNFPIGNKMKSKSGGGADPWDTELYLNIWVCDLEDQKEDFTQLPNGNLGCRNAGFAQLPGGDRRVDGIVIDQSFIGPDNPNVEFNQSFYTLGRTLTHLVGNYLNLYDLWNDEYCEDDYVDDTPVHNAPNYKCYQYKHMSTCDKGRTEMTMNYMDATPDDCVFMFTSGQNRRMQALLSEDGWRKGLAKNPSRCKVERVTIRSDEIEKSEEKLEEVSFDIYPNPTNDSFIIQASDQSIYDIQVLDSSGKTWYIGQVSGSDQVDCSEFVSGIYFIKISNSVLSRVHKIIIE